MASSSPASAASVTVPNQPPSKLNVGFYRAVSAATNPAVILPIFGYVVSSLFMNYSVRQYLLSFALLARDWVVANPLVSLAIVLLLSHAILTPLLLSWLRSRPIFLVDYACYRPPKHLEMPRAQLLRHFELTGAFTEQSLEFQKKIMMRSGLGDRTALPPTLWEIPPQPSMAKEHLAARTVMFSCVEEVLEKTGVKAQQIDVLVVNCSLFCPTPSLSAAIVNHFKMRADVKAFNLGGMGCSANVISTSLVQDVLKVRRGGREGS